MGLVDGVIATESGWLAGSEVVALEFDADVISFEELVREAERRGCTDRVFARSEEQARVATALVGDRATRNDDAVRRDDDTKYYLQKTALRHLPLTATQAARVNGSVQGNEFRACLSPSQLALLRRIEARPDAGWPEALGVDFATAWRAASAVAEGAGGARVGD